jgi:hypothetical protein
MKLTRNILEYYFNVCQKGLMNSMENLSLCSPSATYFTQIQHYLNWNRSRADESILLLSSHVWLRLPSVLIPSVMPNKTMQAYAFIFIRICAAYPAHLILLNLIILITYYAAFFSLISFHPTNTNSLLFPWCQTPRITAPQPKHYKQNYHFIYIKVYVSREQMRR